MIQITIKQSNKWLFFEKISIAVPIIFVFISSLISRSAVASNFEIMKDPHHTGILSTLNLGIRYSSVLESRGVIFYRGFQIDPVIGLFFFDDHVEAFGDSIGYRGYVAKDWLRLRSRLVSISDQPLFPAYNDVLAASPKRAGTYEWSNRAEFFIGGYNTNYRAEVDLSYSKDIQAHRGHYFDLQTKVKLFNFRLPFAETLIEPNLYTLIGFGDAAHNQYFYGPSANTAGFTNFSSGIWLAFPEEADRYYPIVQIRYFQALGSNRNGEYALGRNEGVLFSFIATYGVLN